MVPAQTSIKQDGFPHRLLLKIAIGAQAAAALGDIAIGYKPDADFNFTSIFSIGLETVARLSLQGKSVVSMLIGHYLALFLLPLGFLGLISVWKTLRQTHEKTAWLILGLGFYGYIFGAIFHASICFVGASLGVEAGGQLNMTRLAAVGDFYLPVIVGFLVAMTGTSVMFLVAVVRGKTVFPKALAFSAPTVVQLFLGVLCLLLPSPWNALLFVVSYNLSLLVFYLSILRCCHRS